MLAEVRGWKASGKYKPGSLGVPSLQQLVAGPTDPTEIRDALVKAPEHQGLDSDDRKIWGGLFDLFTVDRYIPAERLRGVFDTLSGLPVSVGETTVGERRLVVIRKREHESTNDLLFDPATGRWAGYQSVFPLPSGQKASMAPAPKRTTPSPYATRSDGVAPDVGRRLSTNPLDAAVRSQTVVLTQAVVEDIGDRP
ncbi:hypothetical protein [Paractinoplanes lichenicola]|uniref:Uncharacterized protein n=1 Tax=Paractinoplanes lichenicola TaxID=2802976 RepID=A0ABS1VWN8_9ACTN|nr:hypothetical protein [Actinoplanes lichenicola]MBL7258902.1 hypothetical protein [Actinoplanes lichenicola]